MFIFVKGGADGEGGAHYMGADSSQPGLESSRTEQSFF